MPNVNTADLGNSALLSGRVSLLAETLQRLQQAGQIQTQEGLLSEAHRVIASFFRDLRGPLYKPSNKIPNTFPSAQVYNKEFRQVSEDLGLVLAEMENVEGLSLGNFNFMISEMNRLRRHLQTVSSKVGDYTLYTDEAAHNFLFFTDSFTNTEKVDLGSRLLAGDQCEISSVEGIATLPTDRAGQQPISISKAPIISAESNGTSGNNQQIGAQKNADRKVILDGNPDTWFEYEKVVSPGNDTGQILVLDLILPLDKPTIINSIRVNPNNFGTPTNTEIARIDTSEDGESYVSIKDDLTFSGFITEDEENIFLLAPSTSKFAGQGVYTFLPRKARFIRVTLKQKHSYPIQTTGGIKNRYAIGVRDIVLEAVPYKSTGELISISHEADDEIRKVLLDTHQIPSEESVIARVKHFVSPDDGGSWHEIRPKGFTGPTGSVLVKEVLNFNVPGEESSIITSSPVTALRYKAVMSRDDTALAQNAQISLLKRTKRVRELLDAPTASSSSIRLKHTPVENTVQLLDIRVGSRGKRSGLLTFRTIDGGLTGVRHHLPFRGLSEQTIRDPVTGARATFSPLVVHINGVVAQRGDFASAVETGVPPSLVVPFYVENLEEGTVSLHPALVDAVVEVGLTPELLNPETAPGLPHKARLQFPTADDKKEFELFTISPPRTAAKLLKKNERAHRLHPEILLNAAVVPSFSDMVVFNPTQMKDFINGVIELVIAGDWSVDRRNGIVYSFTPSSTLSDTTITYTYLPKRRLSEDEWDFSIDAQGLVDGVIINDSAFVTHTLASSGLRFTTSAGARIMVLPHENIVRGSLVFSAPLFVAPAAHREVPFIDGQQEFSTAIETLLRVPALAGGAIRTFPLSPPITTDISREIVFSNTNIFTTRRTALGGVIAVGDYFVDRATSTVFVFIGAAGVAEGAGGTARYYFDDPSYTSGTASRYSVDYPGGLVYTEVPVVGGVEASYRFCIYEARYHIGRRVDPDDFRVDVAAKQIELEGRELLANRRVASVEGGETRGGSRSYLVSYEAVVDTAKDIVEMARFLSPNLKDYALRVLTRSRMVG